MVAKRVLSYEAFLQGDVSPEQRSNSGLQALFRGAFPVQDEAGMAELDFVRYTLGAPRHDAAECLRDGYTYMVPLILTVQLVIYDKLPGTGVKRPSDIKEQDVYFGEIPLMTQRGTFVAYGLERCVGDGTTAPCEILENHYRRALSQASVTIRERLAQSALEAAVPQDIVSCDAVVAAARAFFDCEDTSPLKCSHGSSDRAGEAHTDLTFSPNGGGIEALGNLDWVDHIFSALLGLVECADSLRNCDDARSEDEARRNLYERIDRLRGYLVVSGVTRH